MTKSILMSIRPELLVKILNGEKTIEIRKTMPKCELPIDVYLYCTKSKPYITQRSWSKYAKLMNGLVVAKFTLNTIDWNIDNLVIFDKPMELRDFSISPYTDWVQYRVYKAPQSWQYVWLLE